MIVAASALKHGIDREDVLHTLRNPIRAWYLGEGFTMAIGPNRAGLVLEVGYVEREETIVVIHAMRVRAKFLRW